MQKDLRAWQLLGAAVPVITLVWPMLSGEVSAQTNAPGSSWSIPAEGLDTDRFRPRGLLLRRGLLLFWIPGFGHPVLLAPSQEPRDWPHSDVELVRPVTMGVEGDSVWVIFAGGSRLGWFSPDGRGRGRPEVLKRNMRPAAILARGRQVDYQEDAEGRVGTISLRGELGSEDLFQIHARARLVRLPGGSVLAYSPFDDTPLWAVNGAGTVVAVVASGPADPAAIELRAYSQERGQAAVFRLPVRAARITASMIAQAVDSTVGRLRAFGVSGNIQGDVAARLYVPQFDWPVEDLLFIDNEEIAIRYASHGERPHWLSLTLDDGALRQAPWGPETWPVARDSGFLWIASLAEGEIRVARIPAR